MFERAARTAVHPKLCGDDVAVPVHAVNHARVCRAAARWRHVIVTLDDDITIESYIQPIELTGEVIAFRGNYLRILAEIA